ncbi:MAG: putative selenium-dependent hydroxylase accessory protein YqeC [Synergistaceae bacterium]|nr:putative selenium-dependent hydroxylase accessory protein YqeC [Synergistaceae bacterium]
MAEYDMIKILDKELGLGCFSLFAITGGGGKTSMMYALGEFFSGTEKTLITTTAKIFPPSKNCSAAFIGSINECKERVMALPPNSFITAAKEQTEEKLIGYDPEEIDELAKSGAADKIIVEADGSRGLSIKAYESWEPPVPHSAQCQIVVAGADAFTGPMSGAVAFRLDLLGERYGIKKGEHLSAVNFAAILSSPCEYLKNSPKEAYRMLLINKGELLSDTELKAISKCLGISLRGYDALAIASLKEDTVYDIIKLGRR